MLDFIDNLSDDNGLMNPGTNAWDLRGITATANTHTPMTDREFGHHFDAFDRTPIEVMVSNVENKALQTPAVPMNELLESADQYTDITQAGRYELNLANIADGKSLPVNKLSAKQMGRLIDLIQAGDGMDDVDEQPPSANSKSFNAWLDDTMDSVKSDDLQVGKIEPVPMTPPSGPPLSMSDLNVTPISNNSSWIGRGRLMLRTPTLPRGTHRITSPDGRVRTIRVL